MSRWWMVALMSSMIAAPSFAQGDEPSGWTLTWQDEFDGDAVDTDKWEVLTRKNNFNNEKQYYLPEQASIVDGKLRITATDEPFDGRQYRSARLESWFEQAYGRFEVRARIPTTKGIWPAIWLLPRSKPWPHGGEIDIMEHKGSEPHVVSSAYHFANAQGNHQYVTQRYQTTENGSPVVWPDGFHVYAVEWEPDELRFYVDDVMHYRVTGDDAPISSTPMSVVLNTAVGGHFDGDPDETTVFPQLFDIEYVRVYQKQGGPAGAGVLRHGGFEDGASAWRFHGNNFLEDPPIVTPAEGSRALKQFGTFSASGPETSAVQDGIEALPGREYRLTGLVRVESNDSIAGTSNRELAAIRFFGRGGAALGDAAEQVIADGETPQDGWLPFELRATAPAEARTLAVSFTFDQPGLEAGAVFIDDVKLELVRLAGDFDGDGDVDGFDLGLWQAGFGIASGATARDGDADGDGDVDAFDLGLWQQTFTEAAGAAVVPTPASGVMAASMAAWVIWRRTAPDRSRVGRAAVSQIAPAYRNAP